MTRGSLLAGSFLLLLAPILTSAQTNPNYPDSLLGFKAQLNGLISARNAQDATAVQTLLGEFAIPNSNEWIAAHFSPDRLTKLQSDYSQSLASIEKGLSSSLDYAAGSPGTIFIVKPEDPPRPPSSSGQEAELPLPNQPVSVEIFGYGLADSAGNITRPRVGSFVYIEGRFRFLGGRYPFWLKDLQELRLHGDVRPAQLISRVNPKYPKGARKKHVEGVVLLHAIIGKDGAPHSVKVISGDPLLTESAIEAVLQWRYSPTLLEGHPVEVDTTISVNFQLNH
jgi:TonB family protein